MSGEWHGGEPPKTVGILPNFEVPATESEVLIPAETENLVTVQPSLHDGDLYKIGHGENPLYAEFLNTNGRIGWRLYDKYGRGLLIDGAAMATFSTLLEMSVGHANPDWYEETKKNLGSKN